MRSKQLTPMTRGSLLTHAYPGQGGIIAFAILVLVILVVGGGSIAGIKTLNSTRSVVDQRSLQSYYGAMAGVQEALSTRMYPASNALVWWRPSVSGSVNRITPLYGLPTSGTVSYPDEGIVCQVATTAGQACPTANIIAAYRYFILNGDQGVNVATSNATNITYWADTIKNPQQQPVKIAPQSFSTNQDNADYSASEFVIVSKGYTCVPSRNGGRLEGIAQPGALVDMRNSLSDGLVPASGNAGFRMPYCQSPYNGVTMSLDTTTLVTRVIIDPDTGAKDHVVGTRIVKNDTNIQVGGNRKVYLPGTGWTAAPFSFEPTFSYYGSTTANPATPSHIVFYDFVKNTIICSANITGTTTNLNAVPACSGITPKTVMALYFQGPIDHRSVDPINNYSFEECLDDTLLEPTAQRCNIQVNNLTTLEPELGYQIIFEPPKNNQLRLLPNLQALPGAASNYQITINTANLRSWTGVTGPRGPYTILFRVN